MPAASQKIPVSQKLLDSITGLPLWIKQVIYLALSKDLGAHYSLEALKNMTMEDTLAFTVLKLTAEGEKILTGKKDEPLETLLKDIDQQLTLLDICLRNQWSLETCCEQVVQGIKSHWIQPPSSVKAFGTIQYLANEIRLGEYLVKLSRINLEQLDQALRTQQYIKEALQEHTGIANILINLGYITRQDTEGILFLKEESRKPIQKVPLLQKLS